MNFTSRSLPAFILGLIGSIFGILGGFCTTACASIFSSGTAPLIMIFGGSIVGLVGACMCLNKAKIGSILQILAAVSIFICAYTISGADLMTVLGMLLLAAGGLIGFVSSLFQ